MFESVVPDPGQDALRRAGRIFRVVAVLIAAGTLLLSVPAVAAGRSNFPIGTVIGMAILIYLVRAGKAGLFKPARV
jgi:hypothetical protein